MQVKYSEYSEIIPQFTNSVNSQSQQIVELSPANSLNLVEGNTISIPPVGIVPLVLVLGVTAYQQYRAFVRRQRVQLLEKIWQLSPEDTVW
ncbi:hypothetical protein NIES2119_06775 [[Phormidium ambiguum] IAM M-71]|uniref:Uncharacterized protein n=1 Tax=[Phormidium ambiguum] IAM M-71 TaxID=454136 RepID=A0A1U7IQ32_9CYAN|nr:hypothetical protein [Phormidium ambiguum]OKH39434.1 hypothetical protein NIES2119_06775 [Phormidium ambiguum IAM M-71]